MTDARPAEQSSGPRRFVVQVRRGAPFPSVNMNTLRLTALALLLAACGGAVADSQWDSSESPEYSSDAVVTPTPEPAPAALPVVETQPAQPEPPPAALPEPAPSSSAPSDESPMDGDDDVIPMPDLPHGRTITAPASPATRDDEPAEPAPSVEPAPEPAPAVELLESGEPCTDDAQCESGYCGEVWAVAEGGYVRTDELICAYRA